MVHLAPRSRPKPALIAEPPARSDYEMRFTLRHRRSWRQLPADQRALILHAGADQLETWANQMREEAEIITTAC